MKFYVAFDAKTHHKLGPHILGTNTIAVFDSIDVYEGRTIADELFGENWYVRGAWSASKLDENLEGFKATVVDITSEL